MMLVVVAYDVSTESEQGVRRLRHVAKLCEDFGQRVQNSVFECLVDAAQWTRLRARLVGEIEQGMMDEQLHGALAKLTELQREVLSLRFGLNGATPLSLQATLDRAARRVESMTRSQLSRSLVDAGIVT